MTKLAIASALLFLAAGCAPDLGEFESGSESPECVLPPGVTECPPLLEAGDDQTADARALDRAAATPAALLEQFRQIQSVPVDAVLWMGQADAQCADGFAYGFAVWVPGIDYRKRALGGFWDRTPEELVTLYPNGPLVDLTQWANRHQLAFDYANYWVDSPWSTINQASGFCSNRGGLARYLNQESLYTPGYPHSNGGAFVY